MPAISDPEFDRRISIIVHDAAIELGKLVEDFLIKAAQSQKPPRPLRASEINQNILLALVQFQQHLSDNMVRGLAFATTQMEVEMKKRFEGLN